MYNIDWNKPIEVVTFDAGHEYFSSDCKFIAKTCENGAFVEIKDVPCIVKADGSVKGFHNKSVRNVKTQITEEALVRDVVTGILYSHGACGYNYTPCVEEILKVLAKKGVIDKEKKYEI
jgi:hypothetical protein